MNFHQVSKINLSPDVVDGIVFWTKNPTPMLDRLNDLNDYMYYFQFSITPYGKDIEPHIPDKNEIIIPAFKRLSQTIGADRVIWRYDPIILSDRYSINYHVRAFEKIASELRNYTRKVTISFVDENYRGVKRNVQKLGFLPISSKIQTELSSKLAEIAHNYGLLIDTCAEGIELQQFGIEHAHCVDARLFAKLLACPLRIEKDKTQRLHCGCVESVDIGMYNTCSNGCRYCYANSGADMVNKSFANHNSLSPLISGEIGQDDKVTNRNVKTYKDAQIQLCDVSTDDSPLQSCVYGVRADKRYLSIGNNPV
jgi:hypothetical protein